MYQIPYLSDYGNSILWCPKTNDYSDTALGSNYTNSHGVSWAIPNTLESFLQKYKTADTFYNSGILAIRLIAFLDFLQTGHLITDKAKTHFETELKTIKKNHSEFITKDQLLSVYDKLTVSPEDVESREIFNLNFTKFLLDLSDFFNLEMPPVFYQVITSSQSNSKRILDTFEKKLDTFDKNLALKLLTNFKQGYTFVKALPNQIELKYGPLICKNHASKEAKYYLCNNTVKIVFDNLSNFSFRIDTSVPFSFMNAAHSHPHSRGNGMCLGNFRSMYKNLSNQNEIPDFMLALVSALRNFDSKDTYGVGTSSYAIELTPTLHRAFLQAYQTHYVPQTFKDLVSSEIERLASSD